VRRFTRKHTHLSDLKWFRLKRRRSMTAVGLTWLSEGPAQRSSFCVTFVEGADEQAVFEAFGAQAGERQARTAAQVRAAEDSFDDGYGPFVRVTRCGRWSVAWEETSSEGTRPEVLRRLSSGGRVVSVRHALDAFAQLAYAESGVVVSSVTTLPPYHREGSGPDRFLPVLQEAGLVADGAARDAFNMAGPEQGGDLRAVLGAAQHSFGLSLDPAQLEAAWPCARILPRLAEPVPAIGGEGQRRIAVGDPVIDLLLSYASAEEVGRCLARQVRLLLADTGLASRAVLVRAVESALAGRLAVVDDDGPVGMELRRLVHDRYVADRYVLVGAATGWVPPEEQRRRAARAEAVAPVRAVIESGSVEALAQVLAHRRTWAAPGWRDELIDDFASVAVPREELRDAEQRWRQQATQPRWQAWSGG